MSQGYSYQLLIQQTHSHLGSVILWQFEIHLNGEGYVLVSGTSLTNKISKICFGWLFNSAGNLPLINLRLKGSYHKKILSPKPHILDSNGVW